jgi:O-methyltransferase involved in polyketide biosynthesis
MIAAIRARSSKFPHAITNDPFAEPRTRRLIAIA